MTTQEQYDKIVSLAAEMARVTTREGIKRGTWLPFAALYDAMVIRKELTPISAIDKEAKRKYWDETDPGQNRRKRIYIAQALYVYDLIMEDVH